MIKSVIREYKWAPEIINSLYLDGADYFGLIWWYEDVKNIVDEMKKKK